MLLIMTLVLIITSILMLIISVEINETDENN